MQCNLKKAENRQSLCCLVYAQYIIHLHSFYRQVFQLQVYILVGLSSVCKTKQQVPSCGPGVNQVCKANYSLRFDSGHFFQDFDSGHLFCIQILTPKDSLCHTSLHDDLPARRSDFARCACFSVYAPGAGQESPVRSDQYVGSHMRQRASLLQ